MEEPYYLSCSINVGGSLTSMKVLLPCALMGFFLTAANLVPAEAEEPPAASREAKRERAREVHIGGARWKLAYLGVNADGSLVDVTGVRLSGGDLAGGMSFRAGRAVVLGDRIELGNNFKLQVGSSLIQNTEDHAGEVLIYDRQFKVKGRTKTRVGAGGGDGVRE